MSGREFTEWRAYYRLSPPYPERGDILVGHICATIINMLSKRKGKAVSWDDCILRFGEEPAGVVPDNADAEKVRAVRMDMKRKLDHMARTINAAIDHNQQVSASRQKPTK